MTSSHTCNFKYTYTERKTRKNKEKKKQKKKKTNKNTEMPIGQIQIFLKLHYIKKPWQYTYINTLQNQAANVRAAFCAHHYLQPVQAAAL